MFKVTNPIKNCILLEFKKQKDLALSFCRVQEYYESDKVELKGQFFTFEQFIYSQMNDDGKIDYFDFWEGFNIPGEVWDTWLTGITQCGHLTYYEHELNNTIMLNSEDSSKCYIIGAIEGDRITINHEIAHALYHTNLNYREKIDILLKEFSEKQKNEYKKLKDVLREMRYGENVIDDEIHAYLTTSRKRELVEDFELDYKKIEFFVKKMKKVLQEYNKP
jgi:hypothetical protein